MNDTTLQLTSDEAKCFLPIHKPTTEKMGVLLYIKLIGLDSFKPEKLIAAGGNWWVNEQWLIGARGLNGHQRISSRIPLHLPHRWSIVLRQKHVVWIIGIWKNAKHALPVTLFREFWLTLYFHHLLCLWVKSCPTIHRQMLPIHCHLFNEIILYAPDAISNSIQDTNALYILKSNNAVKKISKDWNKMCGKYYNTWVYWTM